MKQMYPNSYARLGVMYLEKAVLDVLDGPPRVTSDISAQLQLMADAENGQWKDTIVDGILYKLAAEGIVERYPDIHSPYWRRTDRPPER